MLNIFKTVNGKLTNADFGEDKIWINLSNPTIEEINQTTAQTGISESFITSVLDREESSRIDIEDDQLLIVINVAIQTDDSKIRFETIPIGIFIKDNIILTVSIEEIAFLKKYTLHNSQVIDTNHPVNLTLKIIYQTTAMYLHHLNIISQATDIIEDNLYQKMEDQQFIDLIKIEKTLVYFRNSLSSNKSVVDKLYRNNYLLFNDIDIELLDDIDVEVIQAMEMAETRAEIIRSIRDGISSLMSNKLNVTMQTLAAITVILTIPTMIFSFYGMNINLGNTTNTYYPLFVILGTLGITLIIYYIMRKLNFFK